MSRSSLFRRTLTLLHQHTRQPLHTTTFYKRPLPESLVAFSSTAGKTIFREALDTGGMESYFALAEQYSTQSEPAYCGLGTLCMVLNSMNMDPARKWKGPWRWYSEEMMGCCTSLETIKEKGITMEQFWCMAKCNGAEVTMHRYDDTSEEQFREHVKEASSKAHQYLVCSFSRKHLGQTGDGHYSPIGGYNEARDAVLLMDVARFKYPSYWVPLKTLYQSMSFPDPDTGRPRGYFTITSTPQSASLLYKLFLSNKIGWRQLTLMMVGGVLPQKEKELQGKVLASLEEMVSLLFSNLPEDIETVLMSYSETLEEELEHCSEHKQEITGLVTELRSLPLFETVKSVFGAKKNKFMNMQKSEELATLLILTLPLRTLPSTPKTRRELSNIRSLKDAAPELRNELFRMRNHLATMCSSCGQTQNEFCCTSNKVSCENGRKSVTTPIAQDQVPIITCEKGDACCHHEDIEIK